MCTRVPDNKNTIVLVGGGEAPLRFMIPYLGVVFLINISLCINVNSLHVTFRPCRPGLCRNTASEQLRGSNHHGDQR